MAYGREYSLSNFWQRNCTHAKFVVIKILGIMLDRIEPENGISDIIADRSQTFYWQTDRAVEPAVAGRIWADRHKYFNDGELIAKVNSIVGEDKLVSLTPLDPQAQTSLGNVNSVRTGILASGQEIIVRCHPKGISNGYFHCEATAAKLAKQQGLPSYSTVAIHDYTGDQDFAFHVCEKLPGTVVKKSLEQAPDRETHLLFKMGAMMARIHQIKVHGFGPFNNELAKADKLSGLHSTHISAVQASITFNLEVLVREGLLTAPQSISIRELFTKKNPLLTLDSPVLIHNDFADWNLLTDGDEITGIIDWDECIGGDPIADIACWSTFFPPERLGSFLQGYWSKAHKPTNFEDKFQLLRLRYILSKMTLRLRRYSWDPSPSMKEKIVIGKTHLAASLRYFHI